MPISGLRTPNAYKTMSCRLFFRKLKELKVCKFSVGNYDSKDQNTYFQAISDLLLKKVKKMNDSMFWRFVCTLIKDQNLASHAALSRLHPCVAHMVTSHQSLVIGRQSLIIRHVSSVTSHQSLVIGHQLLVICH